MLAVDNSPPRAGDVTEGFALPPRGGKRPSKRALGAFFHPRRGDRRSPLSKRHCVSVLPDSPPLWGLRPPRFAAPPLHVVQKKRGNFQDAEGCVN